MRFFAMRSLYNLFLLSFFSLSCQAYSLGPAGQFDLFVLQDMEAHQSDVEGKIAVGGDATLEDFAVGMELGDAVNFTDSLIVNGNLKFQRGRVYHGNIVTGGNADIRNVGLYDRMPAVANGVIRNGNPLDFIALAQDVKNRSNRWASLSSNASVRTVGDDSGWQLFLKGSDPSLNVFQLNSVVLGGTNTFYLDVPLQSTALINVSGEQVKMSGFGFYRKVAGEWLRVPDNRPNDNPALAFRHDGSLTRQVQFNFFSANTLDIHSIGIKGNILAPWAKTSFYDGHIDGNLIVQSLSSPADEFSGQVNHYTSMPEPSTIWLFIAACLLFWKIPGWNSGRPQAG